MELVQRSAYDESGQRMVRYEVGADRLTHYHGAEFEVGDDGLVRHFFFGGMRIASDRSAAPASSTFWSGTTAPAAATPVASGDEPLLQSRAAGFVSWLFCGTKIDSATGSMRSQGGTIMRILAAILTLVVLLVSVAAHARTEVQECGQLIEGDAVLTADLDCTADGSTAGIGIRNGTLDLAGNKLNGNVYCSLDRCRIRGPGVIGGCVRGGSPLRLQDVQLDRADGSCGPAIEPAGDLHLSDVSIRGYGVCIRAWPFASKGRSRVVRSVFDGCGSVAIDHRGDRHLSIVDSRFLSTGEVLSYTSLRVRRTSISGGGIWAEGSIYLSNSSVTGAAEDGVSGENVYARNSTVENNCRTAETEEEIDVCSDILAVRRARLRNVTCGKSYCWSKGVPCGGCQGD